MKNQKGQITAAGFTIVELMVGIAIIGILTMIAVPSFSEWVIKMRVDNEISSIHRLVLTARNTAINMEQPVTMCPLNGSACSADWKKEVSIFIDLNNNGNFDSSDNETIIRVKDAIKAGDNLTFNKSRIVFMPTGQAIGSNGTFRYCPKDHPDKNRGIVISTRGRVYQTSDIDNDGKDEIRNGTEISC